ncbi:MAG: sulfurtransferase TusA family protein [Bilophila wadsworthia]
MTKELNCCGLACPEPVIRCRRMLEEEKPASLRVLVDNTAASENVSRFLGRTGIVEVRQEGADCAFRHSVDAASPSRNPPPQPSRPARRCPHHHRNPGRS